MKKERDFQKNLKKRIEERLPGSVVFKNDPTFFQGLPDLTILFGDRWALLECKKSEREAFRPNQEYYIDQLNKMSYSAVIYPENMEVILDEMEQSLRQSNRKK